ncbi:phenylalanine 4-monooxygenase [Kiloniella laminariae]|uniref:Phenylalanine-4-hydroxylase n=1 Tax=Kiloniella laminariae TaxID=454162 RepID=A0ABT4LG83_9PROT|nr:phenylalanine 4-monooxygenase [Kiloniella laminariae]MCZ4280118.1 phenylalanine 4-monooxygenase [Kiloniella laminariae]
MGHQGSVYESKTPDQQGFYHYDSEENQIWHDLITRQREILDGRICPEFLRGIDLLGLSATKVPQLKEVSARLYEATGFGVESVPAVIPPKDFFSILANRRFPAATFIRLRQDFDYIKEPDVFHEIFGHCPMLTNSSFADYVQEYGKLALSVDKKYMWSLQRLFWFTVEFGLLRTTAGLRIYGAGLASSSGEAVYCMDSPIPVKLDFDPLSIFRTEYRIDVFQPIYYVIDSFEQLFETITSNLIPIMDEAKALGSINQQILPASANTLTH